MMDCRSAGIAAILLAAVAFSGCWFHGPSEIRDEISLSTGTEYETELGLTLGRTSMAITKIGLDTSEDENDHSLKGVRKLQVGVYHPKGSFASTKKESRLSAESFENWSPLVRMIEDGENVLVLVREKKSHIREMLVIVEEPDELVVVRMKGKLDHLLDDAMELGFDQADRPELFEPALARLERERDENEPGAGASR